MGIFKEKYNTNISVLLTLQKWVHINMVQVERGFRNPTGALNVNHRGMEILPLKVASKLRFGVDLSLTLLPLHTEFRPPSLLCVNSLPLLSVLMVEHVSLHGERAGNNKVSDDSHLVCSKKNPGKVQSYDYIIFLAIGLLLEYPTVPMKFKLKELFMFLLRAVQFSSRI